MKKRKCIDCDNCRITHGEVMGDDFICKEFGKVIKYPTIEVEKSMGEGSCFKPREEER